MFAILLLLCRAALSLHSLPLRIHRLKTALTANFVCLVFWSISVWFDCDFMSVLAGVSFFFVFFLPPLSPCLLTSISMLTLPRRRMKETLRVAKL